MLISARGGYKTGNNIRRSYFVSRLDSAFVGSIMVGIVGKGKKKVHKSTRTKGRKQKGGFLPAQE